MGMVQGAGQYSASGYIGAAVLPDQVMLSVKNFSTSAENADLDAVLTINGNLAKRHLDLGPLPRDSDAFDLAVPPNTDISFFNTVVIRFAGSDTAVATASIP